MMTYKCPKTGSTRPMLAKTPRHIRNCKQYEPFSKDEQEELSKLGGADLLKSRVKPDMLRRYIEQTVANEFKVYDSIETPTERNLSTDYI